MSQCEFDLKAALKEWRNQMIACGITKTADLDELESHLLEDFDKLIGSGLTDSEAFVIATQRIGQPALIKNEFKKVEHRRKYRAAEWILFISLEMLACTTTDKPFVAARFVLGVGLFSFAQFALIRSGFLNHAQLLRVRPYAIVANFIFAALLTGPGIIVQALTALILQLFFEIDVRNTRFQERPLTAAHE